MKVLHITTTHSLCGIANYAASLMQGLELNGVENTVFSLDVATMKTLSYPQAEAYLNEALAMAIDQDGHPVVDAVHIQHEYAFFQGKFPRYKSLRLTAGLIKSFEDLGLPVFVTMHSPTLLRVRFAWQRHLARVALTAGSVRLLMHNDFTLDEYAETGMNRACLATIPHVLETSVMELPTKPDVIETTRQALHWQPGDHVLGMLGFVNSVKNHTFVVEALTKLPETTKLLVIGGSTNSKVGSSLHQLEQRVKALGLQNRVHITGLFDEADLTAYMHCVDAFVAPYTHQFRSSSGAIHMALQSGKPVVTSDAPTFVELNEHGTESALAMFTAGDEAHFLEQVNRVLHEPDYRQARLDATEHYLQQRLPATVGAYHLALYRGEAPEGCPSTYVPPKVADHVH